jgi:ABC-type sugar transport system ATPase subunit
MASVLLQNLTKRFDGPGQQTIEALRALDLEVHDGELLVVVGPSGSGKSTLLRLIAGLEQPTAGSISIGGRQVDALPPQERNVAMVFQDHALYPHMTVRENLRFGLKLRKTPASEAASRVEQVVDLLGLNPLLERLPTALSRGEQQRVALGRAIVLRPSLLLLDEPLSNLDAPLRGQMRREIFKLQRALKTTMVYVTHDQAEAMALGDRIAVLAGGVRQQVDTPGKLYAKPASAFVARFFGTPPMNLIRGTVLRRDASFWFASDETDAIRFVLPEADLFGSGTRAFQRRKRNQRQQVSFCLRMWGRPPGLLVPRGLRPRERSPRLRLLAGQRPVPTLAK